MITKLQAFFEAITDYTVFLGFCEKDEKTDQRSEKEQNPSAYSPTDFPPARRVQNGLLDSYSTRNYAASGTDFSWCGDSSAARRKV